MILLDTNVLSELMRPQPDQRVLNWVNDLESADVAISVMNEAEILHGLARLPDGARKQGLQACWHALISDLFIDRIWPFCSDAAHWYAELLVRRERLARPMASADAVIAAIALAHGAVLATRNTKDFEGIGLELINPWQDS